MVRRVASISYRCDDATVGAKVADSFPFVDLLLTASSILLCRNLIVRGRASRSYALMVPDVAYIKRLIFGQAVSQC